jgi:GntR family transcriptional regulator
MFLQIFVLEVKPMDRTSPKILSSTIDKDTPIPYHYQLRELLRGEIGAGRWSVGEKLPSERELCEAFALSRTTVREAVDALVNEGLLRREKGRGTFVAEPKMVESALHHSPFTDSMAEQGIPVKTEVLQQKVTTPPYVVAQELHLAADDLVILLVRVRSALDEPILVSNSYVPQKLCPSLVHDDLTHNSLYQLLREKYGLIIAQAKRYMEAVAANEVEAELLNIEPGIPLMLIESTVYMEDGTPLEYFKSRHRGDRTRFLVGEYRPVIPEK